MSRERLDVVLSTLGADELRIVLGVAERLALGRGLYGQLDVATDTRVWALEAQDELLDFLVYREISRLQRDHRNAHATIPAPPPEEAPRLTGADRGTDG